MEEIKVLMIGAHRQVKGGISEVVNGYYLSGLDKKIKLKYIATMHDRSNLSKIIYFIKGIIEFAFVIRNYQVIHIHMASRVSFRRKRVFINIAKLFKRDYIIHLHGAEFKIFYFEESNGKKQKKISKVFDEAKAIIVLSESWKHFVNQISTNRDIQVIYNSVACPEIPYKFNKDILFLGRVGARKGIYDVLDIFPRILKKHKSAKLFIGGDGDIEELNSTIEKLGITQHVKYLGWVRNEEKEEFLSKCAIFVLPSYNEGLPMALLEAMAHKCAPISSNVGGIPEVIHDGNTGYLIEPGDCELLYQRLDLLLSDQKVHKRIAEEASKIINTHFNIDNTISQIISVYESIYKCKSKQSAHSMKDIEIQ